MSQNEEPNKWCLWNEDTIGKHWNLTMLRYDPIAQGLRKPMQSVQRCYTHTCCIIYQTKSHKKLWQCQPIIWYKKTFKVSAQVLLHFVLNGSPMNRFSHNGLHYVTFATEYIELESCLSYAIRKFTGQSTFSSKSYDHLVTETYWRSNHWWLRSSLHCCLKKRAIRP